MSDSELDPLSVRPQLKDMIVGVAAMLAVYALLIGSTFALVTRRSLWARFILHMCNNILVQLIVLAGV